MIHVCHNMDIVKPKDNNMTNKNSYANFKPLSDRNNIITTLFSLGLYNISCTCIFVLICPKQRIVVCVTHLVCLFVVVAVVYHVRY